MYNLNHAGITSKKFIQVLYCIVAIYYYKDESNKK